VAGAAARAGAGAGKSISSSNSSSSSSSGPGGAGGSAHNNAAQQICSSSWELKRSPAAAWCIMHALRATHSSTSSAVGRSIVLCRNGVSKESCWGGSCCCWRWLMEAPLGWGAPMGQRSLVFSNLTQYETHRCTFLTLGWPSLG
jgi:hypothetical protein